MSTGSQRKLYAGSYLRPGRNASWRSGIAMAKKTKPGSGRCVHCLLQFERRTWDHVLPISWYPDDTPRDLERWKVPACEGCNNRLSRLEQDLLVLFALCLSPANAKASGISERTLRAVDPARAKSERDARAREAARRRVLAATFPAEAWHFRHTLPGFCHLGGDAEAVAIGIRPEWLHAFAEKMVRGLTYLEESGTFIPQGHTFDFFFDPARGAIVEEALNRFSAPRHRGPGLVIQRAAAASDRASCNFAVEIWGALRFWGIVRSPQSLGDPAFMLTVDKVRRITPVQQPVRLSELHLPVSVNRNALEAAVLKRAFLSREPVPLQFEDMSLEGRFFVQSVHPEGEELVADLMAFEGDYRRLG